MKRGRVALCALAPHPPLLIPKVGRRDLAAVDSTARAMRELARRVKEASPDVVLVVSPHAPLFEDAIAVLSDDPLRGDFSSFGASDVAYSFDNDLELARRIVDEAEAIRISARMFDAGKRAFYRVPKGLDHGVLVPMHFLVEAGVRTPVVAMGMALLSREELYSFGRAMTGAVEALGRRAAIIASGDLSHRLTPDAPAGYDPRAREFDERIVELLRQADVKGILALDDSLVEAAGECGYRSLLMVLGSLEGQSFRSEALSYEGPFGVGYAVAVFVPGDEAGEKVPQLEEKESFPVRLARAAVEAYVGHGRTIDPPDDLPEEMRGRAGVFCTIKKDGRLRGCIGTIEPTMGSVAREIVRNAIASATEDPRFSRVTPGELGDLVYSVDVLMPPERVLSVDELDPKAYGVIVRKGRRRGLLLPDLEGIDTGREQVAIAMRKAGIPPGEDVELWRFEVKRYM